MKKMENILDKIIPKIALPIIVIAALLLVFWSVNEGRRTSEENNAYIRVINCIVSHNASVRTQENIEGCYVNVEKDLDIHLKRYDSSDEK